MPGLRHGGDDLLFMYRGLVPQGGRNFGAVMTTVVGNPAFTLESLLEPGKLIFRAAGAGAAGLASGAPVLGVVGPDPRRALLRAGDAEYPALIDIHYQYSAHFLAFLFPVLVLGLPAAKDHRRGALAALILRHPALLVPVRGGAAAEHLAGSASPTSSAGTPRAASGAALSRR